MTSVQLPKYRNPPLNELVIGVRFTPLIRMRAEHAGLLWRRLIKDFPNSEQVAPLGDITQVQGEFAPMPRFWFTSADKTKLVQLQRDRFLFNWRQTAPNAAYPSYDDIVVRFLTCYENVRSFSRDYDLGEPDLLEAELTYLNHLDARSGWHSIIDTGNIIKAFTIIGGADALQRPIEVNMSTVFSVGADETLTVRLQTARRRSDGKMILIFELTDRGRGEAVIRQGLREWLDQAHERIVLTFESLTEDQVQHQCWGKIT